METSVQFITENNQPAFAVIPYAEYEEMRRRLEIAEKKSEQVTFPLDVAEMNVLQGYSLVKAWRIYLKKTQKEVAAALGITQSAFSQIEKSNSNHTETLLKIANYFGISIEQLEG